MQSEQITDKEAISLISVFIMGSTLILGIGGEAKNNAWISGIIAILFAIPVFLIYSRILSLYPGKDLFEILGVVFGKHAGKLFSLLYIWYAFHLGAMVIRNFGEFVNTVAMPETPMLVPMFFMGLVCIIAVRSGLEVMARTSAYLLPIILFIEVVIQLMAIPELRFENLKPIMEEGISPVLKGGFTTLTFPFAETILFLGVFSCLKNTKSPFKVYYTGLALAGSLIVILTLRNILILGNMLGSLYFPSHVAVSHISIGEFLQRLEVTVAFVFIVGVCIKASVCLLVACKGIASLFRLSDYGSITIQTGLLMIFLSQILYKNIMDMRFWAFNVYKYYAFPFQILLPTFIWVLAEISTRRSKRNKNITTSENDTLF